MNITDNKKVIVAMSGGVDSSVAAKLLSDKGREVVGIFLHFWKDNSLKKNGRAPENKCCSTEALMDARRVCQKIGIPLYTLNFAGDFKKEVVDYFLNEYGKGNTPNPCVRCNKFVKLGLLIKYAEKMGFDFIASGQYAVVKKARKQESKKTIYKLYRAKDKEKDQSYFLYSLTQDQLKHLIFPLGNFTKDETRKMARKFKLPVAGKKDSQEVCFIPEKSHNEFLKRHLKLKPGPIVALTPSPSPSQERGDRGVNKAKLARYEVIGKHQGLPLYTIGQRKGVEIGGTGPYYAAKFDYKKNILYVVNDANDPALFSDKLTAKNINWIFGQAPKLPFSCKAVIRYRHKAVKCRITPLIKGAGGILVKFSKPQRAVTPGQSIVFYKGEEVLGGGIIDRSN
jgi:tRNA-specific 2-thiouridylase